MAQKKKASQSTPEVMSAEDIASRLSSAAELIGTTEAEAEQKRQQTRAQLRESEESAQARMSESERQRSEAAETAKSVAERKLAALSYAENYRERMQSERAKARKQKQAQEAREKEEAEARQREERQARIDEMLRREQEELDAQNARAEEMLRSLREKSESSAEQQPSAVEEAPKAPEEAPKEPPKAPEAAPKEPPKAPEQAPAQPPRTNTPDPAAFDKYKTGEEDGARPDASEPLTFDLSDIGLEGADHEEDEDVVIVDEEENEDVSVLEDASANQGYSPTAYPYYQNPYAYAQQDPRSEELSRMMGELNAERQASRARTAQAEARQAEVQRRSIEMMIAQENTRAEREERIHRENAEREERLARERAEREERIARESRENLSGVLGEMMRRQELAERGQGEDRDEALAREIAASAMFSEEQSEPATDGASDSTGSDILPLLTVGGITYEEEADRQKALSKAERRMQKQLRRGEMKDAMAFIKRKKKENAQLRAQIKELRRMARSDKSQATACTVEELNTRLQIIDNLTAMLDYAKEFKKNTLARSIRETLREEVSAYNRCAKKSEKNDEVDAQPIEKDFVKNAWAREALAELPRAKVLYLPTPNSEDASAATGAAAPVAAASAEEESSLSGSALKKATDAQCATIEGALVALEKAVAVANRKGKASEKAHKKGKGIEKADGALQEALTALDTYEDDVSAAIDDLSSLYDMAVEAEPSLVKQGRLQKQRDKKLKKYEDQRRKILEKLTAAMPPNGGGGGGAPSSQSEEAVNFSDDTNGAAANAEGVRITNVALPTTRDTLTAREGQDDVAPSITQEDTATEAALSRAEDGIVAGAHEQHAPSDAQDTEAVASGESDEARGEMTATSTESTAEGTESAAQDSSSAPVGQDTHPLTDEERLEREMAHREAVHTVRNDKAFTTADQAATLARIRALKRENRDISQRILYAERSYRKNGNGSSDAVWFTTMSLNERADIIENLGKIILLAKSASLTHEIHSAISAMNTEVRTYNADVRALQRLGYPDAKELPKKLGASVLELGQQPGLLRIQLEDTETGAITTPMQTERDRQREVARSLILPLTPEGGRSTQESLAPADAQQSVTEPVVPVTVQRDATSASAAVAAQQPSYASYAPQGTAMGAYIPYPYGIESRPLEPVRPVKVGERSGAQQNAESAQRASASEPFPVVGSAPIATMGGVIYAPVVPIPMLDAAFALASPTALATTASVGAVGTTAAGTVATAASAESGVTVAGATAAAAATAVAGGTLAGALASSATASDAALTQTSAQQTAQSASENAPTLLSAVVGASQSDGQDTSADGAPKKSGAKKSAIAKENAKVRKQAAAAILALQKENLTVQKTIQKTQKKLKGAKNDPATALSLRTEIYNARADMIENLEEIFTLAAPNGLNLEEGHAITDITSAIREQNLLARQLQKSNVDAVILPTNAKKLLRGGQTLPTIARLVVSAPALIEGESTSEVSDLTAQTASAAEGVTEQTAPEASAESVQIASEQASAPSAAGRDDAILAQYDAYRERQLTRQAQKSERSDRKSAEQELDALQKENASLRERVSAAASAVRSAEKKKQPVAELVVSELNERAALIENLAKIILLAGALENVKVQTKAKGELNAEALSYNKEASLLSPSDAQAIPALSEDLVAEVLRTASVPTIATVRVAQGAQPSAQQESTDASATAATLSVVSALEAVKADRERGELVITTTAPATAEATATTAETSTAESAPAAQATAEEAAPKASSDEAVLAQYDAYNQRIVDRQARKLDTTDRKTAQKQLSELQKQTDTLRTKVSEASATTLAAKKKKTAITAPAVTELNARVALIDNLSRIIILAGALGESKLTRKAAAELGTAVKAYNATVELLPAQQAKSVSKLSESLADTVIQNQTLPALTEIRIEELEEKEIVILPAYTSQASSTLASALSTVAASSPVQEQVVTTTALRTDAPSAQQATAEPSEESASASTASAAVEESTPKANSDEAVLAQYDAYNRRVVDRQARKLGTTDRKAAQKQLTELQKQADELRRGIANAKADVLGAKRKKNSTTAPVAAELNAHASLIECLSKIAILSSALGRGKVKTKASAEIATEIKAYNAALHALPKTERKSVGELPATLTKELSQSSRVPQIPRIRIEELHEEPITILPAYQAEAESAVASALSIVSAAAASADEIVFTESARPAEATAAVSAEQTASAPDTVRDTSAASAEAATEESAPKANADDAVLAQYEAYHLRALTRRARKGQSAERKAAEKQLSELEKQADELRRTVADAKASVVSARRKKACATSAVATELNGRASLIESLARIIILSDALGKHKVHAKATSALTAEIKSYNAALHALSKAERKSVGELPASLANQIVKEKTVPQITRISVQTPPEEEPITILPSYEVAADTAIASAMSIVSAAPAAAAAEVVLTGTRAPQSAAPKTAGADEASAPVSASVGERTLTETESDAPKATQASDRDQQLIEQYTAYNDALYARKTKKVSKKQRKALTQQISELQRENDALYRKVSSARSEALAAKKAKQPTLAATAAELNERAALIENLAKVVILTAAASQTKLQSRAISEIQGQVRMYNAAVRTLPKAQRKAVGELSADLAEQIRSNSTVPSINRIRIDEEEEITILPVHEASQDPIGAALTATAATAASPEIVLTGVSAPQSAAPTSAPQPKQTATPAGESAPAATQSEQSGVSRTAERERALLAEYTAHSEQLLARNEQRELREKGKTAKKQLAQLTKKNDELRRKLKESKAQIASAKKKKESTTALVAAQLNDRADLMRNLAVLILLTGAVGQTKAQSKAISELSAEIRVYNATVRTLPKAQRKAIGELPETMVADVLQSGSLPTIATVRVEELAREDIEILPSPTAQVHPISTALAATAAAVSSPEVVLTSDPVKQAQAPAKAAEAQTSAASAPQASAEEQTAPKATSTARMEADERVLAQFNEYNEQLHARNTERLGRADRKEAVKQISSIQKSNEELRRTIASAKAETLGAKKKKASTLASTAKELNARASLIENLARIIVLSGALAQSKTQRKAISEMNNEIRAYNSCLRTLPQKQRRALGELSRELAAQTASGGSIPGIKRLRVENGEEDFVILPSPATTSALRGAITSASLQITPEELVFAEGAVHANTQKDAQKQIRQLNKRAEEISRRVANAEAAALSAKKQKTSLTPALCAQLNARASLIETYAKIISLARASGLTKIQKTTARLMDTAVQSYNATAKELSKSESVQIPSLPARLSAGISIGSPMSAIPRIRLDRVNVDPLDLTGVTGTPETIVITPTELSPDMPLKKGATDSVTLQSERVGRLYSTSTEPFDKKKMREYLKRQQKQIAALQKERTAEQKRTESAEGAARVGSVLRVRNATARIIAVQIDCMEMLRDSEEYRRELTKLKSELQSEIRRYNKATDTYKKLTGKKLTALKGNLPELILRGEPYEAPKLAQFTEEQVTVPAVALVATTNGLESEYIYENLSDARSGAVARAKRRARTEDYARDELSQREASELAAYERAEVLSSGAVGMTNRDHIDIEAYERHEYRNYVKAGEKEIRQLRQKIDEYTKQNLKAQQESTHAVLIGEIVNLRRALCEVYFRMIKTGVAVGESAQAKKYAKLARREITTFNSEIKTLSGLVGVKYPKADVKIPNKLLRHVAYTPMPTVTCELDPTEALRAEEELRARQSTRDARQKRIDGELARKRKKKDRKKAKAAESVVGKTLSKNQIKKQSELDITLINARYEEKLRSLEREITECDLRYTMHPAKAKEDIRRLKAEIRQIKKNRKAALRAEKRDNKRYFALLAISHKKLASKKLDEKRAADFQLDLAELLEERQKLNERLLALYRGVDSGSDVIALRAERIYIRAYRKAMRQQRHLTRRIGRMHITIAQKEKLFDVMNRRARLEAQLTKEKKKLSLFKLRGKARRAQKLEIKKLRAQLTSAKKEFDYKMRVRVAIDKRYVSPESMVMWFFALVALIGLGVVVYVFRTPIWNLIKPIIDMLSQGNSTGG